MSKYIDINDLPGWDSPDRWPSKDGRPLPKEKQLKEVVEDADEHLRLCPSDALYRGRRRDVHDGKRTKSNGAHETSD